jgi:hypothetical protein
MCTIFTNAVYVAMSAVLYVCMYNEHICTINFYAHDVPYVSINVTQIFMFVLFTFRAGFHIV